MLCSAIIFDIATGRITTDLVCEVETIPHWPLEPGEDLRAVFEPVTQLTHWVPHGIITPRPPCSVTLAPTADGFRALGLKAGSSIRIAGRSMTADQDDPSFSWPAGLIRVEIDNFPEAPAVMEVQSRG